MILHHGTNRLLVSHVLAVDMAVVGQSYYGTGYESPCFKFESSNQIQIWITTGYGKKSVLKELCYWRYISPNVSSRTKYRRSERKRRT